MRTALFLTAGFLLIGALAILARLFSHNFPAAPLTATIVFIALWFGLTAFNMWVGVAKAGYSFSEELPIFLMLFAIPAVAAILLRKLI